MGGSPGRSKTCSQPFSRLSRFFQASLFFFFFFDSHVFYSGLIFLHLKYYQIKSLSTESFSIGIGLDQFVLNILLLLLVFKSLSSSLAFTLLSILGASHLEFLKEEDTMELDE